MDDEEIKEIIFDEKTAALLVKDTAELVVRKLMVDQNIRLDDEQMTVLAGKAAELINMDIDYPAIADNVINSIPQLKDNTDLFITEAVRGDLFEKIKKEIIKPVDGIDGKDGKDGLPGVDGDNYMLTTEDRRVIAETVKKDSKPYKITKKIRADLAENTLNVFMENEEAVQAIVEAVLASERVVSRDAFITKLRELRQMIDLSKKQKKGSINAGISGGDMVAEINKEIGTTWQGDIVLDDPGLIEGFFVRYLSTNSVSILGGKVNANGKTYTLADDTKTHTITGFTGGYDLHYIYIDDSASTAPTPVIINSTVEPAPPDLARGRGRYNGDDRCIGVAVEKPGGNVLAFFEIIIINQKHIRLLIGRFDTPRLAANLVPDGNWQEPNESNSDVVVPVNATEINLHVESQDLAPSANSVVAGASLEWATINTSTIVAPLLGFSFGNIIIVDWIPLGVTREVQIAGDADDDKVAAFVSGFGYDR